MVADGMRDYDTLQVPATRHRLTAQCVFGERRGIYQGSVTAAQ